MCNTCQVYGRQPASDLDRQKLHVYTHPLVRCRERVEDPPLPKVPTIEDLAENVRELEKLMDTRTGQLREYSEMDERINQFQEQVNARLHKLEEGLEMVGRMMRQLLMGTSVAET